MSSKRYKHYIINILIYLIHLKMGNQDNLLNLSNLSNLSSLPNTMNNLQTNDQLKYYRIIHNSQTLIFYGKTQDEATAKAFAYLCDEYKRGNKEN